MGDLQLYDLADALGVELSMGRRGRVRGRTDRDLAVAAGGVRLSVPIEVVSSLVIAEGVVLLCRSIGDLGLSAIRTQGIKTVDIGLLDLTRLEGDPENLFERVKPGSIAAAQAMIEPAEVKAFQLVQGRFWQEIGVG